MAHGTGIRPFSDNTDFDFEIRVALGNCVEGAGEPGEILAAVSRVGKGDHDGWFDAWSGLGERAMAAGVTAAAAGHDVSAAEASLRASAYFSVAVNAASALADPARLAPTFAKAQESPTSTASTAPGWPCTA